VFAAVSKNRAAGLGFHYLNARAAADAPSQGAHEYSAKNSIHVGHFTIQINISQILDYFCIYLIIINSKITYFNIIITYE
jgi:hypothetical protein